MKIVELKIPDHAKFHFGDAAGKLKRIFSSDQLVSAITNNLGLMYGVGAIKEFIDGLMNDQIRFSSVFYGLDFILKKENRTAKTIYFLPRPKVDIYPKHSTGYFFHHKAIKKIAFVSSFLYQKLSESWNEDGECCQLDLDGLLILNGSLALAKEELQGLQLDEKELERLSFFRQNLNPRVEVNRLYMRSENYFTQEELEMNHEETKDYRIVPFMYFFQSGPLSPRLQAAISLLADEGIGGKRSLGKGFFQGIGIRDAFELPETGKYYMNLSVCFPHADEVGQLYNYEIEKRSGYIYSMGGKTVRKKSAMVIGEGSLFRERATGQIIDVGPKNYAHPVYLYGKPIFAGFGGEGDV